MNGRHDSPGPRQTCRVIGCSLEPALHTAIEVGFQPPRARREIGIVLGLDLCETHMRAIFEADDTDRVTLGIRRTVRPWQRHERSES